MYTFNQKNVYMQIKYFMNVDPVIFRRYYLPQVAAIVANNIGVFAVSKNGNLLLNDIEVLS